MFEFEKLAYHGRYGLSFKAVNIRLVDILLPQRTRCLQDPQPCCNGQTERHRRNECFNQRQEPWDAIASEQQGSMALKH